MQLDALVALPLLRNLAIDGSMEGTPLYGLKALSQLRELELEHVHSDDLVSMCQPPHSLQLESLRVSMDAEVGEVEMRALVHLPTLTELDPSLLASAAWPMLPQLPHLRRLTLLPVDPLNREGASSLSAALSRCAALEELTLQVDFCQEDGSDASEETEQMR
jgi:hypothetical protein